MARSSSRRSRRDFLGTLGLGALAAGATPSILSADERVVKMRVDGNVHEVELGMVREAKLVFELDTKPKPGKGAKRKASKPRKKKGKR